MYAYNLEAFLAYFDVTKDVDTCLVYSTGLNLPSLWEYFLSNGANINARCKELNLFILQFAITFNCSEAVEFLISHGIDINEKMSNNSMTALHWAIRYKSIETADVLISHGIDINGRDIRGQTCLLYTSPSPRD